MLSLFVLGGLLLENIHFLGGSSSWSEKIGYILSLTVFIPLYKLFKMKQRFNFEIEGKLIISNILLLSLWFLIPITYLIAFDKIECMEASINPLPISGAIPMKCYKQEVLNKYFGEQEQDKARSKTFDYNR